MVIKHLENKIRLVGIICTAFLAGCIIISVSSIWTARTMVTDAQKKVYVLDGNVPILVTRTTMDETLDVEAKSHVEMFHHYFFTLAPDDKYIRYTMEKAMYLVDETGLAQYNTLKEKGFYSNILGTSAVFSIFCDSISFDKKNMEFTYYGRQRIERRSNILMRELVTAGQLKRVPRTDNNPHGLLITNWRTLLNKDIEQKTNQYLTVEWVKEAQEIIDRYAQINSASPYLLPIIQQDDGTEQKQYHRMLENINYNLKKIGEMTGLKMPLTTYTARHTWASIARDMDIPIPIISEGMGHNSIKTTQVYLNSIDVSKINEANKKIIRKISKK